MANSTIRITNIPTANTITLSSKILAVASQFNRTELISAQDLASFLSNTSVYKSQESFATANSAYTQSNSAFLVANSAYSQANLAYQTANAVVSIGDISNISGRTNNAHNTANSAYIQANVALYTAQTAYTQANVALYTAQTAFDQANVAIATAYDLNSITQNTANAALLTAHLANSSPSIVIDNSSDTSLYLTLSENSSGNVSNLYISNNKLYFNPSTGTLSATVYNTLSDESLKNNIINITNGLEIVNKINPVSFEWKDSGKKSFGVIANQLETIVPELVTTEQNKTVNYDGIIAFLIASIQELSEKIKKLESN